MEVKSEISQGKYWKWIYFLAGFLAFVYVFLRSIKVGITYDEAWTLNSYVPSKISDLIFCSSCEANNHLLNTLLIKLFFLPGQETLFWARLPNVLAFVVYLIFAFKISTKFVHGIYGLGIFLLLILNPFVLDFFSLARGYGLALAFQLGSLYYLFRFVNKQKSKSVLLSLVYASLSVLSNYAVLNYLLVLVLVIVLLMVIRPANDLKRIVVNMLIVLVPLGFLIYKPIIQLKFSGNLYYGGSTGFYADTLTSFIKYSLYNQSKDQVVEWVLNIFLLVVAVFIIASFFYNKSRVSVKSSLLVLLLLSISWIIAQHYLLGVLYPIDRTALWLYPMLVLLLCCSLNDIRSAYSRVGLFVVVILFSLNFLQHANLYKTALWYYDAHSAKILDWINEKGKEQNQKKKVDFSWPFQSSVGYYCSRYQYPFVEIVQNMNDRDALDAGADYYIYLHRSLEKVGYEPNHHKITTMHRDTALAFPQEAVFVFTNFR